ncbi:transcriptional regulator, TetR family [Sphingomonas sp. NFR04]|uniref:TetR/AcrR family transcriptional regulator n=1 Tax=Sphingomonas sp. NFR04 TaxID=1566283 RepID=UPI0008E6A594|nr:TetR/AcrR family transcriptional regulator [Sphingomonas sp. NFR04]SFK60939.1 transcriptional regulator, TetR family [Sphingomonas sp. NFR04]
MTMGRPRSFDTEQAVAAVLPIFMAKGYEGATFGELIAAMGIKPPSFYAAFGSKEQLFQRVIDLYAQRGSAIVAEALARPTAFEAIEALLRDTADADTDPSRPGGCLFVQGALTCSDKAADVRADLAGRRLSLEPVLQARIEQAKAAGDESVPGDPAKVARFVSTLVQGLAVQAASGAARAALHDVVDVALNGLRAR